ncbi:MAG: DUF1566 domain-containing protein [Desulfobacterales bacterium]|nr:DUF1566 domain-containing protein [Desulfobacterales bacterium]
MQNVSYKDPNIPDLETSVNDANAMANLLRERYGFEVKLLLDHKATREAIYRVLRSVAPAQSLPQAGKPFDEILEAENVQHEDKEKRKEWQQADVPADDYSGSDSKIETRGGTFIAYANGVIYDKITGLEWYAGPDKSTNWNEAKRWVENLNVAGGNWRMPTRKDIKTLFKRGEGTRNMTPLLKTSGWWVWSRETQGSSSAWAFAFIGAGREILSTRNSSNDRRGFAVRLRRGE